MLQGVGSDDVREAEEAAEPRAELLLVRDQRPQDQVGRLGRTERGRIAVRLGGADHRRTDERHMDRREAHPVWRISAAATRVNASRAALLAMDAEKSGVPICTPALET